MFILPFYHQDLQNMSVTICLALLFTSIVETDKRYLNTVRLRLRKPMEIKLEAWCLFTLVHSLGPSLPLLRKYKSLQ